MDKMHTIKLNKAQVADLVAGGAVHLKMKLPPEIYTVFGVHEAHEVVSVNEKDNSVIVNYADEVYRKFENLSDEDFLEAARGLGKKRRADQMLDCLLRLRAQVLDHERDGNEYNVKLGIYSRYLIEPTAAELNPEPEEVEEVPEGHIAVVVTQEMLDDNPDLVTEGVEVGDTIYVPEEPTGDAGAEDEEVTD